MILPPPTDRALAWATIHPTHDPLDLSSEEEIAEEGDAHGLAVAMSRALRSKFESGTTLVLREVA